MTPIEELKTGEVARQILIDLLGFEPKKNKPFVFSDESKQGNDYLHEKDGYWYIKNFATGKTYNALDAWLLKHPMADVKTAVAELSTHYLGKVQKWEGEKVEEAESGFSVSFRPEEHFSQAERDYWWQYGITEPFLTMAQVIAVDSYRAGSQSFTRKKGELWFAYQLSENCCKLYRPGQAHRFLWLGEKPADFPGIFGLDTIPAETEILLICEGVKDALAIQSHSFLSEKNCFPKKVWAVGKDNAQADLPPAVVAQLKEKYRVILCLDADEAGLAASQKHSQKHGLPYIDLRQSIELLGMEVSPDSKDIADLFRQAYFELKGTQDEITLFKSFFEEMLSQLSVNSNQVSEQTPDFQADTCSLPTDNCLLFNTNLMENWLNEAQNRPVPRRLFDYLWFENEVCILYADTNLGKSILAVQLADALSRSPLTPEGGTLPGITLETVLKPNTPPLGTGGLSGAGGLVLYFDFELSDKQVEARYSADYKEHYRFHGNLLRSEINTDYEMPPTFKSFEDYLAHSLEQTLLTTGAKIVIIDNLTYLKNETEKAKDALPLMKHLKALKKKYELSILILAHTPKRDLSKPITRNDLQGSKMLISFCDSAFAIGESHRDKSLRYIKQIKARNSEVVYDTENVITCQITKPHNFLHFEMLGFDSESSHLKVWTDEERAGVAEHVKQLAGEGKTQREIARTLGIGVGSVNRYLNK
jgi:hypothetical protein